MLLLLLACRAEPSNVKVADTAAAADTASGADTDSGADSGADSACTPTDWYADTDDDGFGGPATVSACEAPDGYVATPGDCDDGDAAAYPGAPVACTDADNNCDGAADNSDADGDRFLGCEECDDTDATAFPGATEVCDDTDDDCDGGVDEDAVDAGTWYTDDDGDSFGAGTATRACDAEGRADNADDCDDARADVHPGASEVCNDLDDDCDGTTDEDATDATTWYDDDDGDGYGAGSPTVTCDAGAGHVVNADDCDDTDAGVHPGADEICNAVDDDCDGDVDQDAIDAGTWFIDYDGDGFGSDAYSESACDAPRDYVATDDDCDDTDSAVNPAAIEVCNTRDDDCDSVTDEDDAADALTWYFDADSDGHGDAEATTLACEAPADYVAADDDCDDADGGVYPGAPESCDGLDENCDDIADDGALGADTTCAAASCQAILDDGSSAGDGLYWLDPDEDGDTSNAWEAYCDMTDDGGGWTRIYGSLWPYWWDSSDWEEIGAAGDDNYSMLIDRAWFADGSGVYTYRLEVGNADTWATGTRAHYTTWQQGHDAFSDTTDGSDYVYIAGEESTTCSGFNGLHDQYYHSSGVHCMVSDVDATDYVGCWWMQIIPLQQYVSASSYPGYLEGYGGPNTHVWHTLWVR